MILFSFRAVNCLYMNESARLVLNCDEWEQYKRLESWGRGKEGREERVCEDEIELMKFNN